MLLPIKNMNYLPIIRFKNRWQTFDLNLHYPYSVNEKIITYTHLGYRGDACYIVDNDIAVSIMNVIQTHVDVK